ncbi:MAG TPA: O-antigen ligase family protein, partial [Acidimicrobiales bacterium]|nr:O-antigen ligase family protein [Acidimicrobiales bacterium]
AVCLVLLGPGLVALARLARRGERAAHLAALFVAAAALSTAWSHRPWAALTGAANWGTGLVFVAALAAAWALGAAAGDERRRQVATALVAAAVVNAAVAWLQARGLVPPALESEGRSGGLMGNPVHLGALAAGGLWLVCARVAHRGRLGWGAAAVAVLAGAAQLSGGRSALGLSGLVLLVVLRRAGWRRGAAILAASAVGFLAASAWVGGGAATASERTVGSPTRQLDVRAGMWRMGAEAALERPLLGWGPGRFEEATSPRTTAVVSEGGVSAVADAHNWVVEYAVTTGAVGLVLLGGWLALAGRGATGPLAGFAALVGLFTLFEPQSVALTPLALLALGASYRRRRPLPAPTAGWRASAAAALAAGVAAAAVLLAGEARLHDAQLDTSPASWARAAALLPAWPEVSAIGSRIEAFHGLHDQAHAEAALGLARQATRRDPSSARAWAGLARLELKWGSDAAAVRAAERALERNPWSAEALLVRAVLAERAGDDVARGDGCRRLAAVGKTPPVCGGRATFDP